MSFVDKIEARSSVELNDSCNCTYCCPRVCCWPRKVKKVAHHKPVRGQTMPNLKKSDSDIEITATGIKVHTASQPVLTQSGHWDIVIDGQKIDSNDTVAKSIKQEHGIK